MDIDKIFEEFDKFLAGYSAEDLEKWIEMDRQRCEPKLLLHNVSNSVCVHPLSSNIGWKCELNNKCRKCKFNKQTDC